VSCQLDHLYTCLTDREIREALTTLPPTLSETYSRILKRIPPRRVRIAQMALNFIAFANPRLEIPLLEVAVSVPATGGTLEPADIIHQDAISGLCSSLVRKSDRYGNWLEFAHFSVREFLDSDELARYGLEHFRISAQSCTQQLAIQSLRYLMLDKFDQMPEGTMGSIEMMKRVNQCDGFHNYAAVFWAFHACAEWTDPVVADLTAKLFDPRKTPAFTCWAATLHLQCLEKAGYGVSGLHWEDEIKMHRYKDDALLVQSLTNILDDNFRPLHLAAILGLSDICDQHLGISESPSSAVHVNSPLGTPLQCAVAGLWLFGERWTQTRPRTTWSSGIVPWPGWAESAKRRVHCADRTVECFLLAGARCTSWWPGEEHERSLIAVALVVRLCNPRELTTAALLLARVATTTDDGVKVATGEFEGLVVSPTQWGPPTREDLEAFVMSLDRLVKDLPVVLPLACLVWNMAVKRYSNLTQHTSLLDDRISLAEDPLPGRFKQLIYSGDADTLTEMIIFAKFNTREIYFERHRSLLHVVATCSNPSCTADALSVMANYLLMGGCSPSAADDAGQTPLHVWDWEHWDRSRLLDPNPLENFVQVFLLRGQDVITTLDQHGWNVLHAQAARNFGVQLKTILEVIDPVVAKNALRAISLAGNTPLMEALSRGHQHAASVIEEFLARFAKEPSDGKDEDGDWEDIWTRSMKRRARRRDARKVQPL
jgi:hypothetical protein